MNSRHQQDLEGLIEHLGNVVESQDGIINELREILAREAPDREIVRDARLALAAWYGSIRPRLYPDQGRPQFRVLKGGKREGPPESRQPPLMGSS